MSPVPITRVVQESSGVTIDVQLTSGTSASYTVAEGVSSVVQDGSGQLALQPAAQR